MARNDAQNPSIYLPWFRQPIVYTFGALLVLISIISLTSYRELLFLKNEIIDTYEVPLRKIQLLDSMVHHSRQRQVLLRDIAISEDPFDQDEFIQEHHRQAAYYLEARNQLAELVGDGDESEYLQQIIDYNTAAYQTQLEILDLSFGGDREKALGLIREELGPSREKIYPLMLAIRDMLVEKYTRAIRRDQNSSRQAGERIILLYVSAVLVGAFLAFLAYRMQQRHNRAMAWQATHDSLTGLANRFQFEYAVMRAIQGDNARGPFGLVYLDLDQFKLINDTVGHTAGDELLRQVSAFLNEHLPDGAEVARIGGDEFAVLVPGTTLRDMRRFAERSLRLLADRHFVWVGHVFRISASMGIVVFDPGEKSAHELFAAADIALHTAKENGRNRYHVYTARDSDTTSRMEGMRWATKLEETLSRERIKLYQQPIVRIDDPGQVTRQEVLIRYLDGRGTLHGAYRLIDAAEKYGFASQLDEHVVSRVLDFIRKDRGGISIFNVNLSGQTLDSKESLVKIVGLIDASGVDPSRVCFEITETSAITRFSNASRFIKTLKGMGCGFALDDFGTGVSSFEYLERLPVDMIKIDSSFIRKVTRDKASRAIVLAIREVAGVFGATLVAEGVENQDLRRAVADLGIEYGQGFGISEPRPLESTA